MAGLLVVACAPALLLGQSLTPSPVQPPVSAEQRVSRHFENIRAQPPALRAFLRAMPKGADLHNHVTGAIYAETYVAWAAEMPLCVDTNTLGLVDAAAGGPGSGGEKAVCREPASQRPASDALQDPTLYRSMIDAFSTRAWNGRTPYGHYQFFDAWRKFGPAAREGRRGAEGVLARGIAEITERAALQNVAHLELMMSFGAPSDQLPPLGGVMDASSFAGAREKLLAAGLRDAVAQRREWLDGLERARREALRCAADRPMKGCALSVRYIPYALRGFPPDQVFAQAVFAFELAAADSRIAGVNLVMPEDWFVPMRDYDLHMQMYGFLRQQYPQVRIALHAGELAFGLVPPEKLGTHVRQAMEVGGAQRIGHGTDIMYDSDPHGLLREIVRRGIAIEISLSSSDIILGVRGSRHPLRQFLRAGVPIVIATDDEGVARSDLTNEYQRAAEEHGLGYADLKRISRNSIEHSFLTPAEKAQARKRLETAYARFEAGIR